MEFNTAPTAGDVGAEYYVDVEVTGNDDATTDKILIKVTVVTAGTASGTIFIFQ